MSFVCKALQNTNFARASCDNLQKLHEFGSHIDQIVMYITTVSSLTYGEYLDMMNQYLENEITREELMFRPNTMIAKEAKRHREPTIAFPSFARELIQMFGPVAKLSLPPGHNFSIHNS